MKIYYAYSDNYDSEGFYDDEKDLITFWSLNDANFRIEYMNPLFQRLGVEIENADEQLQDRFERFLEVEYNL